MEEWTAEATGGEGQPQSNMMCAKSLHILLSFAVFPQKVMQYEVCIGLGFFDVDVMQNKCYIKLSITTSMDLYLDI